MAVSSELFVALVIGGNLWCVLMARVAEYYLPAPNLCLRQPLVLCHHRPSVVDCELKENQMATGTKAKPKTTASARSRSSGSTMRNAKSTAKRTTASKSSSKKKT